MTESAIHQRPDPGITPSLSGRLREGTREVHERVETATSFNRLIVIRLPEMEEDASNEDRERALSARADYREVYRRFLIAAHGFESAVDAAFAASPAHAVALSRGYPAEPTPSTALIRDDLRQVFGAEAVDAVGIMDGLPAIRALPELVGTEYVRRGSRAGGAFISAIVHHNLGLTRETGASFLMQYGKQTRSVITTFKEWIDSLGLSEGDARIAVNAAIATFSAVQDWHTHLDRLLIRS